MPAYLLVSLQEKASLRKGTNNNNNNNWNLYSTIFIHKMFKSAAHCHSLSHSQQRLNGQA